MIFRTFTPKRETKADKKWFLVNAEDKTLGRLATEIAVILRGKNKPTFSPHTDCGDFVIVINAEKVVLTGRKNEQKEYIHHTGYLGHLKRKPIAIMRELNPSRIIEEAVAGMIPRNKLKKIIMSKLKVYAGSEHPHTGQSPETLTI